MRFQKEYSLRRVPVVDSEWSHGKQGLARTPLPSLTYDSGLPFLVSCIVNPNGYTGAASAVGDTVLKNQNQNPFLISPSLNYNSPNLIPRRFPGVLGRVFRCVRRSAVSRLRRWSVIYTLLTDAIGPVVHASALALIIFLSELWDETEKRRLSSSASLGALSRRGGRRPGERSHKPC